MNPRHITSPNLLDSVERSFGRPAGAPRWAKFGVTLLAAAIVGGGFYTVRTVDSVSSAFSAATNDDQSFFEHLGQLIVPPERLLEGEADDRVNALLLGMGGEGHQGAYLTDTIIVASLQPSTGKVAMLSIPRDLTVNIPGYDYRKINNANAIGETDARFSGGSELTRQVVEEVIGQPIHYFVRLDFAGFEQFIDDIGGITVNVRQSFTDAEYPTENFGFQTVRFTEGEQEFDGATALTYVRSRHGTNGEGSDFARSKRQQQVILASKEKFFSLGTFLNPAAIADALATFSAHVEMNLELWELVKLAKLGRNVDVANIEPQTLDTTPEGLLLNTTGIDGAYLLVPAEGLGKYGAIQEKFAHLFDVVEEQEERASVEIQNGTSIVGFAARTATALESLGIEVTNVSNASERTATETVIYDLTGGKKPRTLSLMRDALSAEVATSLVGLLSTGASIDLSNLNASLSNQGALEAFLSDTAYAGIDFVIVLGTDQEGAR